MRNISGVESGFKESKGSKISTLFGSKKQKHPLLVMVRNLILFSVTAYSHSKYQYWMSPQKVPGENNMHVNNNL